MGNWRGTTSKVSFKILIMIIDMFWISKLFWVLGLIAKVEKKLHR